MWSGATSSADKIIGGATQLLCASEGNETFVALAVSLIEVALAYYLAIIFFHNPRLFNGFQQS